MFVQKSSLKPLIHETHDGKVEVSEYGGLDEGLDLGVAVKTGNYPGEGKYTCNRIVETMTFFVISGRGMFYKVEVDEGETVEVLMASNLAWSPEQVEVT